MPSGIYAIIHRDSGRWYVGQSVNVNRRWNEHRSLLIRGEHINRHLQYSWNKYGEDAFDFDILIVAPVCTLDDIEQAYLDDPETSHFNMARDAVSPMRGRRFSEESRAKISEAQTGRRHSEETRAKISASNKGKNHGPMSDETRAKISASNSGRTHAPLSDDVRAKISASKKGVRLSDEHRSKLSAARKGRVLTPETKAKIGAASKQRRHTPEARAKISAARRSRESKSDLRREQPRRRPPAGSRGQADHDREIYSIVPPGPPGAVHWPV